MRPNPANRLGLDYADQARHFARHPYPIIDAHAHIVGPQAAQVYRQAAQLYGIGLTYSMTPRPDIDAVRSVLGDSIRFIAVPDFSQFETLGARLRNALGPDYACMIEALHRQGVRLAKFRSAPRRRPHPNRQEPASSSAPKPATRRRPCPRGRTARLRNYLENVAQVFNLCFHRLETGATLSH